MCGHLDWINCIEFSSNGKLLATGSEDKTIRLWDLTLAKPKSIVLEGHSGWVFSVKFSPNNQYLVSGGADNDDCLWDVKSGLLIGFPLTGAH